MSVKRVLVLRTCNSDMTSYNGFIWPESGPVKAPDWKPEPICGFGLHGALWGEGNGNLFSWDDKAKWLVVSVPENKIVDLDGKVKFPYGNVVFCGDRKGATEYLQKRLPKGRSFSVIGASTTVGDYGTATVGDYGTATVGDNSMATAGNYGTATTGEYGTATVGYRGTATVGDYGTATAGNYGTATAGDYGAATAGYRGKATAGAYGTATAGVDGTATVGNYGTATAGDIGTATAGDIGTATVGYRGTATVGDYGTAMAGESGTIVIQYYDTKTCRYRWVVGYIGENDLKPNTKYKLNDNHEFVEA